MKDHLRVVGIFIHVGNDILIVHRHPEKPSGHTWALPSGKVEFGETDVQTIVREVQEELSLKITEDECEFLGSFTWEYPEFFITYPTFRVRLKEKPVIVLKSDELVDLAWQTADTIYSRDDLIRGFRDLLEYTDYINK